MLPAFLYLAEGKKFSFLKEKPPIVKISPMFKVSMRLRLAETPENSGSFP